MYTLASGLSAMSSKKQVNRLGAEYMFLAFESFDVYGDIRYLIRLMNTAHEAISRFKDMHGKVQGLDETEGKDLVFYTEYTSFIADAMQRRVDEIDPEIVDEVIDYWQMHDCKKFGAKALDAAKAGSRLYLSREVKKIYIQNRDIKVDQFLDAYFGLPFKDKNKGKWK